MSGRNRLRAALAGAAGGVLLAAVPIAVAPAASTEAQAASVTTLAVTFQVVNKNDSLVPCPADGRTYTIHGHLTGPGAALAAGAHPDAVTLYNHGHSFGEFLWTFSGVPGYDTVGELAKLGHVSLTYDRLGYGASGKPNGYLSCYGSEADVSHQIVGKLRSGDYQVDGRAPISFRHVAYVGHSQEAFGGEPEVYSFHDVDAYVHLSFVDQAAGPPLLLKYGINEVDCLTNPAHAGNDPNNPSGYAYRGRTDQDFQSTNFVNVDPRVVAALTAMRTVDPCGFPASALTTLAVNNVLTHTITTPVLLMFGADDPNFVLPIGARLQLATFSGARDRTLDIIPNAGHAMMFSRTAPRFRQDLSAWLTRHGF